MIYNVLRGFNYEPKNIPEKGWLRFEAGETLDTDKLPAGKPPLDVSFLISRGCIRRRDG